MAGGGCVVGIFRPIYFHKGVRKQCDTYWWDFMVKGKRYRGNCHTNSEALAIQVAAQARFNILRELSRELQELNFSNLNDPHFRRINGWCIMCGKFRPTPRALTCGESCASMAISLLKKETEHTCQSTARQLLKDVKNLLKDLERQKASSCSHEASRQAQILQQQ